MKVNQLIIKIKSHNQHSCHVLPQYQGGIKYVCPFWIRPTGDFLTHLRKSFKIKKYGPINAKTQVKNKQRKSW